MNAFEHLPKNVDVLSVREVQQIQRRMHVFDVHPFILLEDNS